ncbi:MAG: DUF1501 domain-containing protein [Burkholderiales bacterium]
MPRLVLAAVSGGDRRLVFVFLRGGMDGLASVPATGDPGFEALRGEHAGEALKLDATFGLSPHLVQMHGLYGAGELAVLHAVASPYRERSHFDAQNLLENGTVRPYGRDSGWLNAALVAQGTDGGVALGQSIPLVLRGQATVTSWSPSKLPEPDPDLLARLAALYQGDSLLERPFAAARESQNMMDDVAGSRDAGAGAQAVVALAQAAGEFLGRRTGPRVASLDFGGWDSHINQVGEYSPLTRNLKLLDRAMAALKGSLGEAWRHTAVLVVTEFGRTVALNGSHGTDHGTATAAFVAGGAVRGGRVIAEWPGLADRDLYQGRDLRPTFDLRALFKAALVAQLGLGEAALETQVFPGSGDVKPLEGLFA